MGYNVELREMKPKRSEMCDYFVFMDAYMVLVILFILRFSLRNYL